MRLFTKTLLVTLFYGSQSYASLNSGTIVVLRGQAKTGDNKILNEKDKVSAGSTVITGQRSFVRLLFPDNTQLNIGPDTTMRIEPSKPGEASIVSLVGGQIRAKVTKDPLLNQGNSGAKEKMVIKTKTAAMGIRGTDFNVSFNPQNNITALITFEGNVAMTRLDPGTNPFSALQSGRGVQSVGAGQFSGVQPDLPQASIPVKISPSQLETLKGNDSFQGLGESAKKQDIGASPVPPGVDPKGFASGSERALQETVARAVGEGTLKSVASEFSAKEQWAPTTKAPPPEGFLNKSTGEYAPRAGGFLDLASGRYVPPPSGSSFDPNTGVFVPPKALGSIDPRTGMYVPPKGVDLDPVKGFVAEAKPSTNGPRSDGQRFPSGSAESAAPVTALVIALNEQTKPENVTKTVTLDNSFSAGGSVTSVDKQFAPPPPPPSTAPPPKPPENADPVSERPVSNNCATDNSCGGIAPAPTPTTTGVKFTITVQ